tara:strand:+ start:4347 stop:4670 length:324 start_codon:yes stop_codon:yes gene_type:complete
VNEKENQEGLKDLKLQVDKLSLRLTEAEEKTLTIFNALKVMHRNEERIYKELDTVQYALSNLSSIGSKRSKVSLLRGFVFKYHILLIAIFLFFICAILTGWLVSTGW